MKKRRNKMRVLGLSLALAVLPAACVSAWESEQLKEQQQETQETVQDAEEDAEEDAVSERNVAVSLPDGVYTPDQFSWSGGTGKVNITCDEVTVTESQAYATIVFDSDAYGYVKVNDEKYEPSHGEGTSVFVIPVTLNSNNEIIGMTTKMSAAHEITYSLYIYLAAADQNADQAARENASGQPDLEVPEIPGFAYKDTVETDGAEYFRLYEYTQDVMLLEIDMKTDTGSLYEGDRAKYLLVPEGVEVPAGLDKEMAIVNRPVQNAYIASETVMELMDQLGAVECIAASGCEQENCKTESVALAMAEGQITFAGNYEETDFKQLLLHQCELAVLPAEALLGMQEETAEYYSMLGIPMIVDRSSDETDETARGAWRKVYGILFGHESEADALSGLPE